MEPVSYLAIVVILAAIVVAWTRRFLAVGALAIANLVVFLLTAFGPSIRVGNSFVPVIHADLALWAPGLAAGEPVGFLQLLTAMFVHADFGHFAFNMIPLIIFALHYEERIGHRRFLAIYLGSGLVGTLVFLAPAWGDPSLLMGASGAVFGVIGAFAAAYPNLVLRLPIPLPIMIFVRMRVMTSALLFAGMQIVGLTFLSRYDNTAYLAHIGGLAGGAILGFALKPRDVERPVVDFARLDAFAQDHATRDALQHLETSHDLPDVFNAWFERFWRGARCPTCRQSVKPRRNGTVDCETGHHFDLRKKEAFLTGSES